MNLNRIFRLTVFVTSLSLPTAWVGAQPTASADEQAIRQIVDRENAGARPNTTDQAVFWSGAYARPVIGKPAEADRKKMMERMATERANQQQSRKIERVVVAASGDVAYEYGTFRLIYDSLPDNKHVDHEGAYLRTWRKEKGQWLADITFMRPFGNMSVVADTK